MSETPEREPLESALASLKPAPLLERDRLMFAAGQASATPARRWLWPAATAALLCVSLGLGAALAARPRSVETVIVYREVEKTVPAVPVPDSPPSPTPRPQPDGMMADNTPAPPAADYLRLRRQVLRFGVESLPDSPPLSSGGKDLSIDSLIEPPKKRL